MLVKLLHDTIIRFNQGATLEVSDQEASRLVAFGNAVIVEKKAEPEAKPAKKKTKA